MNKKLELFSLLVLIEFILDPTKKMKTPYCILVLFFHHIISIYAMFGSLIFGYHLIHFIFLIITCLLFLYYKRCFLTIYTNNICNISQKNTFQSFGNHISKTENQVILLTKSYVLFILMYDLYHIVS